MTLRASSLDIELWFEMKLLLPFKDTVSVIWLPSFWLNYLCLKAICLPPSAAAKILFMVLGLPSNGLLCFDPVRTLYISSESAACLKYHETSQSSPRLASWDPFHRTKDRGRSFGSACTRWVMPKPGLCHQGVGSGTTQLDWAGRIGEKPVPAGP